MRHPGGVGWGGGWISQSVLNTPTPGPPEVTVQYFVALTSSGGFFGGVIHAENSTWLHPEKRAALILRFVTTGGRNSIPNADSV